MSLMSIIDGSLELRGYRKLCRLRGLSVSKFQLTRIGIGTVGQHACGGSNCMCGQTGGAMTGNDIHLEGWADDVVDVADGRRHALPEVPAITQG